MYTMSDAHLGQWTPCTSYRLQKSARHCCKQVLRETTVLCSSTLPRLFVTWASKMPLRRHSKTTVAVKAVCSVKIICIGCMRVCAQVHGLAVAMKSMQIFADNAAEVWSWKATEARSCPIHALHTLNSLNSTPD